jgi:AcrR family transcriptional regulator
VTGVTETRTRNRRGEGSRLRDEIVAGASALLDETGDQSAITLRSVARRVGIAAPSIYRHFPDQPAIMLAVVRMHFAQLEAVLRGAAEEAGADPWQQLYHLCDTYLRYAEQHPERYRVMFGGLWKPTLGESSVTANDVATLGDGTLGLLTDTLRACVDAGQATSTDPYADAVVLWLGLHGLAHQRSVSAVFPWPADIAERMITSLAHVKQP